MMIRESPGQGAIDPKVKVCQERTGNSQGMPILERYGLGFFERASNGGRGNARRESCLLGFVCKKKDSVAISILTH